MFERHRRQDSSNSKQHDENFRADDEVLYVPGDHKLQHKRVPLIVLIVFVINYKV